MTISRLFLAAVAAAAVAMVTPVFADPPQCEAAVAAYNRLAGKSGVPDVLSGWTTANASTFRFKDPGGGNRPAADSGVSCSADGSLEQFDFALSWTGDPPLAAMASAQIAVETMAFAVAPDGRSANFADLTDRAVGNAEMLHLATQAEWAPLGNGYQAYASITRNPAGGGLVYAIRRVH